MSARCHQVVFTASLLALCWFGMMAVHESGHILGALLTGGSIERVVLHPLAISRTDVSPNPQPAIVVWMGPIIGCTLPLVIAGLMPSRPRAFRSIAKFFAGFCLVANGVYIGIGSFEGVGDCGTMLATGSPPWSLVAFGATAVSLGIVIWHKLGSLVVLLRRPSLVTPRITYMTTTVLIVLVVLESCLSSR